MMGRRRNRPDILTFDNKLAIPQFDIDDLIGGERRRA